MLRRSKIAIGSPCTSCLAEGKQGRQELRRKRKIIFCFPVGLSRKINSQVLGKADKKCTSKRRKSIPLALMYDSDGVYFCDRTQSQHAFVCFNTVFLVFTKPFEKKANQYQWTELKP